MTTLTQYLDNSGDPTELRGYGLLVDLLVDMAGDKTEEDRGRRVAYFHWEPVDLTEHERTGQPFGAWPSVGEYRAHNASALELIQTPGLRERFLAAMPTADRLDVQRRIWEREQPVYEVGVDQGGGDVTCSTCNANIGGADYLRIMERFSGPSRDDVTMCVGCITGALSTLSEPSLN